jgi:cation diffusion facilitator CzcD-associated flavoprotein CzcO/acetyl esterase/lipase
MTSRRARLAAWVTRRRIKPRLGDMRDIERVRRVFGDPLPFVPKGARWHDATLGGVAGEWVEPASSPGARADASVDASDASSPVTLLYVHGGGFVGCSPKTHRPITASFARAGLRVFVPDYRLAPEHPFPAGFDDVLAAWRGLRAEWQAAGARGRLVLAGDSAGGGLALALMVALRDAGERGPDAAVLFSPCTDMTGTSPSLLGNTERDAMFHGPSFEALRDAYLQGADPTDPRASPLQADLSGLPPILIHVGQDEVLLDDSLRVVDKIRAAGGRVDLGTWPDVAHCWQILHWLPESRDSMRAALRFLREAPPTSEPEHLDVLVIGAGLSGIGTGAQLQRTGPQRRYAVLEARDAIGGTWDLFRYPGIRSDSDMHTLGYAFHPWKGIRALADGPSIRDYVEETADAYGVRRHIRFGHRVVRADWSSERACWTVHAERGPERTPVTLRCDVLLACSGYYRYDRGYRPEFAGEADFRGTVVHPQLWPEGLSTAGKRIVVIGSGATAVTLVPELAKTAAHVTMLQRSPSYVLSLPGEDGIARVLKRVLPEGAAYRIVRAKNIVGAWFLYFASQRWPARVKSLLMGLVRKALGPGHDVDTHFNPKYGPWDQRLCLVPDGDLFQALKSGRAEVVTDTIQRFTPTGLKLASGRELEADVVVTATGLELQILGGATLSVDGHPVELSQRFSYKSVMFSGVPNLVSTFGYTNASWTLKADLTAAWACRLLDHLDRHGQASATPRHDPTLQPLPFLNLSSGYVRRAEPVLPHQAAQSPWKLHQNWFKDWWMLKVAPIEDGTLEFTRRGERPASRPDPAAGVEATP